MWYVGAHDSTKLRTLSYISKYGIGSTDSVCCIPPVSDPVVPLHSSPHKFLEESFEVTVHMF